MVKFEPGTIFIVPPVKVQVLQEQVLSMVTVTPGEITILQLVQMAPVPKEEVLTFDVMGYVVCAFAEKEMPVIRVKRAA
jgi:hypothetical protein